MTPADLKALRKLAEARKAVDLAALERLMAEARACEAEIVETRAMLAAELGRALDMPPDRLAARAAWGERRIAEARARIVALGPRITAARAVAAASLGKDQALGELIGVASREAARVAETRREREAPPPEERREE